MALTFHLPKKCVKVFSKSGHNRDKNLIGWRVQASFHVLPDLLFLTPALAETGVRASSKKLLRLPQISRSEMRRNHD